MSWARAAAFNLAYFGWTALLGMLGLPWLMAPRRAAMRFGRLWSKGVLVLLRAIVGLDHRVVGLGRLPDGGAIVAMKHQSAWDAIALPVVLDDPAPVVKRELLWLPFYGWYMARAGAIAIDRKGGGAALRKMLAPGASAPYQPGVFALYQRLQLPIVPAAVNSGCYWGRRAFLKRPGRITLEFLEPIPPGWPRRRLMAELEKRIEERTAALARAAEAARRGSRRPPEVSAAGAETGPRRRG